MRLLPWAGIAISAVWLSGQTEDVRISVNYREVMIPMRDGVRLQTVILTPKNPTGPRPFLIQRTPYGVPARETADRGFPAAQRWNLENYIVVAQNIRGRFKSEGTFVMFRLPHDPKDAKGVEDT